MKMNIESETNENLWKILWLGLRSVIDDTVRAAIWNDDYNVICTNVWWATEDIGRINVRDSILQYKY